MFPQRRWMAAVGLALSWLLAAANAQAQEVNLQPGEAIVTQFSGTVATIQPGQAPAIRIDPQGAVAKVIDVRRPGFDPAGQHWLDEPQRNLITAEHVGQVFAIALDDDPAPNIYLAASAFAGLHRDGDGWMDGQWGQGGGPDSIWKLDARNGYAPRLFASVTLDGRHNSGAALGDLAFDPYHRQLFVSDLESGMIHAFSIDDGTERGRFDHGIDARSGFLDVPTGETRSLPTVEFDPSSAASLTTCAAGNVAVAPECWNLADFRRRVWGLSVHRDNETGEVRLFYALWSNAGFGNSEFEQASPAEKTNSVWSVGLDDSGRFRRGTARLEFLVLGGTTGDVFAISDIAFPRTPEQQVMLLGRHRGIVTREPAADSTARPPWPDAYSPGFESPENLVWRQQDDRSWRPSADDGAAAEVSQSHVPVGQNMAGGVDFGFNYTGGSIDEVASGSFMWITANHLCPVQNPCLNVATRERTDISEVHGLLGIPLPPDVSDNEGRASDAFLAIDIDVNADAAGNVDIAGLARRNAGAVGDVEVFAPYPEVPDQRVEPVAGDAVEAAAEGPLWPLDAQKEPWWPAPLPLGGADAGPDLALQKAVPFTCVPGASCTVVAVVTNIGGGTYASPIRIRDLLPNDWQLTAAGPAGSNWSCQQLGPEVVCTDASFSLAPGQQHVLAFEAQVPAQQVVGVIRNCAAIEHAVAGIDANAANDEGCTDLAFDGPAPGAAADGRDLSITKLAQQASCAAGGPCSFTLRIANTGTEAFEGQVSFIDVLPAGWVYAAKDIGWWCMLTLGGGDRFACRRQQRLEPGQSIDVSLAIRSPANATGSAENCAELDWSANERDARPDNDRSCAAVNINAPEAGGGMLGVDLSIDKRFKGQGALPAAAAGTGFIGGCQQGAECAFDIIITNRGPGPFDNILTVVDEMPADWKLAGGGLDWMCITDIAEPTFACRKHVVLEAGTSEVLTLNMIPRYGPDRMEVENCVKIDWSGSNADTDASNDRICLLVPLAEGRPDLVIRKKGPAACERGVPCAFDIEIQNIGSVDYEGPLSMVEEDDDVFEISSYGAGDPWLCKANPRLPPALGKEKELQPGRITCTVDKLTLAPGKSSRIRLTLLVSQYLEESRTHYQNCVRFAEDPDNDGVSEEGCHTFRLVPKWDLAITKEGRPICYGLARDVCDYTYAVTNAGSASYQGPVSIIDEFAAGLGIELQGWSPRPPNGWNCEQVKDGELRCDHPPVKIEPGETMREVLKLTVAFGKALPPDLDNLTNVATVKYLGGPPDANEANDRDDALVLINHSANRTVTGETKLCSAFDIITSLWGETSCYNSTITPELDFNGDGTRVCRGPACTNYEFVIGNSGATNYRGELTMDVTLPQGARFLSTKGEKSGLACKAEAWSCTTSGNKATCSPGRCILGPGEETSVDFEVKLLPDPAPAIPSEGMDLTTCAELKWTRPSPVNPIEQRPSDNIISRSCVTTRVLPEEPVECPPGQERDSAGKCEPIAAPVDLAISKKTIGDCSGQESCRFQITVESKGSRPFKGRVAFRDTFSRPGARLTQLHGRGSCSQSGQTVDCIIEPEGLAPGNPAVVSLDIRLPHGESGASLQNCAEIYQPDPTDASAMSRDEIRMLQRVLDHRGFDPGPIDGAVGSRTRNAVSRARASVGLEAGTQVDRALLAVLLGQTRDQSDLNPGNNRSCVSAKTPICGPGYSTVRATGECVCVAPRVERDGQCVAPTQAPKPPPRLQAAPQPQPVPQIRCDDGRVDSRNRCICPSGWTREQVQRNWYRCVRPTPAPISPTPQIKCVGGALIGGFCICPPGNTVQQLPRGKGFRCVAPQPVRPAPQPQPVAPRQPPRPAPAKPAPIQPRIPQIMPRLPQLQMICPPGTKWVPEARQCIKTID